MESTAFDATAESDEDLFVFMSWASVVEALAHSKGMTLQDLTLAIEQLRKKKMKKKDRVPRTIDAIIEESHPREKASVPFLRELAASFDAGLLLPNSRDVNAFLARESGRHRKFKSRREALAAVIKVLAGLDSGRLRELSEDVNNRQGKSEFFLFAQEVMGKTRK